jgi:multidrug efflux pump subunit AcrA (membrane-fusion protein)
VTVVVPGRQQVPRIITATGQLAARRDMPVGIAGEGGRVVSVLVEQGQWVGAGQTLAVIDRSVQAQEAAQLAASINVARADCAARPAGARIEPRPWSAAGFVSKADVERRTAARDAANARVHVAQAALGQSRARIGRLDIRAPAGGLVLARAIEPGQIVGAGSGALFRIAKGGEMEMLAALPEADPRPAHHRRSGQGHSGRLGQLLSGTDLAGFADHRSAHPPGRRQDRASL